MVSVVREYFKVLNAVVLLVVVLVVNNFTRIKDSSKMPFHHKAMLANIASYVGMRMFSALFKDITILVNRGPSLPRRMILSA